MRRTIFLAFILAVFCSTAVGQVLVTGLARVGSNSSCASADSVKHDGRRVPGDSLITDAEGVARFQPLEAILTDIADGIINADLVNTANPWADNEVVDDLTINTQTAINVSTSGANATSEQTTYGLQVANTHT